MYFHRTRRSKLYQRVKYARSHLSRGQYTAILAQPLWRRIQRTNLHIVTDPYSISTAALKCHPSKRIKMLSRPTTIRQKYDPEKAADMYADIHRQTLTVTHNRRINELALPKLRTLIETRKFAVKNKAMFEIVNEQLSMVRASRYQKYHVICNAVKRRAAIRKNKSVAAAHRVFRPEEWQRHMKNLEKLAAPKVVPRSRSIGKRKKWKPVNMKRIEILALPIIKEVPHFKDLTKVPSSALNYKITPHVEGLAVRKNPPEVWIPRMPGAVSSAALKAIATPRIVTLAKAHIRPPGLETDLKENAFAVSPAALKAKCSKRINILAKPKIYGK